MYHTYSIVFYVCKLLYTAAAAAAAVEESKSKVEFDCICSILKYKHICICVCVSICYSLHSLLYSTHYSLQAIACAHLPKYYFIEYLLFDIVYCYQNSTKAPNILQNILEIQEYTDTHLYLDGPSIAAQPIHMTCMCVYLLHEKAEGKKRAENNMQKHKIIVVVKSSVHFTREW